MTELFSFRLSVALCLMTGTLISAVQATDLTLPAFPGAVGYGQIATGWRGGEVVKVTNTEDSGPGSLRHCLEDLAMPRVCIVETSGTIALDRGIIVRPNVYLAGQTAPGDGIQLRLSGRDNGSALLIIKNSHDVLIRNLKSRPGPGAVSTSSVSALLVENSERVMLDRLSLMFASDQVFTIHADKGSSRDITLQRSIVAYGLNRSNHPKGRHSKGALICSIAPKALGRGSQCGFVTLWQNLFAHNNDRNPDVNASSMPIQVVGNLFYNAKSQYAEVYDRFGSVQLDYVGNVVMAGPSTRSSPTPYSVEVFDFRDDFDIQVYMNDNLRKFRPGSEGDDGSRMIAPIVPSSGNTMALRPLTLKAMPLPVLPVGEVREAVLREVGDHVPGQRAPDPLDRRVLNDVAWQKGRIIDHPDELGGYPAPQGGIVAQDADGDGMDDVWERRQGAGFDPERFDPWADLDGDGWPNLEEYLSVLAGDPIDDALGLN